MTGNLRRWSFFVALHALAIHAAATGFRVSVSYQSIDLGFGPAMIGLVAATLAIPPAVTSLNAGLWADRSGGFLVLLVGDILFVISCLLPLTMPTPLVLFVGAAMHGLGLLLSIIGQQALIGAIVEPKDSERAFGSLFTANAIGQGIGPLAATGLASMATSWSAAFSGFLATLALAVLALASAPLIRRSGTASVALDERQKVRQAVRIVSQTRGAWPIIMLNAVVLGIIDVLSVFLPMWGQERMVPPAVIGMLLALRAAASILIRTLMKRIIVFFGRRRLLLLCSALVAAGCGGLSLLDVALAPLCMILIGIGGGLSAPISLAWLAVNVPAHVRGSAMGVRLTANRIVQALLPVAVGTVSGGTTTIFATCALLAAGTALLVRRIPFNLRY